MSSYTPRSYETARAVFSILEFVAWTAVVVGIIAAFAGASVTGSSFGRNAGMAVFLAAIPGIVLSVVGLIAAAMAQNARAGVDSAEMSGHMLKIAEEQLRLSKEMSKVSYAKSTSFEKPKPSPPQPERPGEAPTEMTQAAPRTSAQSPGCGSPRIEQQTPSDNRSAMPTKREPVALEQRASLEVAVAASPPGSDAVRTDSIETASSQATPLPTPAKPRPLPPEIVKHRGVPIKVTSEGAFIRELRFADLDAARSHIDANPSRMGGV